LENGNNTNPETKKETVDDTDIEGSAQ